MGSFSLLQGIFLTQESNRGFLHCRQILYQLSYQGSPQSNSGSSGKQTSGKLASWAVNKSGMCLRNTQSLVSHCFFPLRRHPSFQTHPNLGHCFLLRCLGGCTLERDFSWGAQNQQTWRLGDFSKVLVARPSSHHPLDALGSMVPARENQMVRFKRGSIKCTHPDCLNPSPVQSWGPKPGQIPGIGKQPKSGRS